MYIKLAAVSVVARSGFSNVGSTCICHLKLSINIPKSRLDTRILETVPAGWTHPKDYVGGFCDSTVDFCLSFARPINKSCPGKWWRFAGEDM